MRVREEQRRLERVFGAILLSLSAPATFVACSEAAERASPPADASVETGAVDAEDEANAEDATPDAGPDAAQDAPAPRDVYVGPIDAPSCFTVQTEFEAGPDSGPDAQDMCDYYLACGLGDGAVAVGCNVALLGADGGLDGYLPCRIAEGMGCTADAFSGGSTTPVTLVCSTCFGGTGRRPFGLRSPRPRGAPARTVAGALGRYLGRAAHDEAAAVFAFERMSAELAGHGAPRALVRAATRARADEIRHAGTLSRLARSHGARVPVPRVAPAGRPRPLFHVARENAVEGCVRETFGALIASWQACNAGDPAVARAMRRIAGDETRHAALSWAVARWLEPRLPSRDRARVERARIRAMRALARKVRATAFPDALVQTLGLPRSGEATRMCQALARSLFGERRPALI